jgi:hypothetical protein
MQHNQTFQYSKKSQKNLDKKARNERNISNDFNWKLYVKLISHPKVQNNVSAYDHYNKVGKKNPTIYHTYWRKVYRIPNELSAETYKKHLSEMGETTEFNEAKDVYAYFASIGHSKYPLSDAYARCHFEIPKYFDCDAFKKYYSEFAEEPNNNVLYYHHHRQPEKYPLNDDYLRLLYNIPIEFSCQHFQQYFKLGVTSDEETYRHFSEHSDNYILDDQYLRFRYTIPSEFQCDTFSQYYNLDFESNVHAYKYYSENRDKYPLDDGYMRTRFKASTHVNCAVFKQRYADIINPNTKDNDIYELIHRKGDLFPLDDTYYDILYKTNGEFKWKLYLEAYPWKFTGAEVDMGDVYHAYFSKKASEDVKGNNDQYYKLLYDINADFDVSEYKQMNDCFLLENCSHEFVFQFVKEIARLEDIYHGIQSQAKTSSLEKEFLERYEYIQNIPKLSEHEKRIYFKLKDFATFYYSDKLTPSDKVVKNETFVEEEISVPIEKTIYKDDYITHKQLKPKTKKINTSRYTSNTSAHQDPADDKRQREIDALMKRVGVDKNMITGQQKTSKSNAIGNTGMSSLDALGVGKGAVNNQSSLDLLQRTMKSKSASDISGLASVLGSGNISALISELANADSDDEEEQPIRYQTSNIVKEEEEEEDEYEEYKELIQRKEVITEYETQYVQKKIVNETKTKYYRMFRNDLQINEQTSSEQVFQHVCKYNFNLYLTYRYRSSIFNTNTSFTTSKKQNSKLAIFLCFSANKPIIFDVLLNNINSLGDEWNHLILCSGNNEKYIKSLTSLISTPIQIKTISSKSVTYDDINNLFLDASFWKKYHENYVFVYDENTILSQETNTKLTEAINEDIAFVGTSLPFSSYANNKLYGFASLRKRSHLIATLENHPQLLIENYGYLEKEVYNTLGLQNVPEFVVFSQGNVKTKINLDSCIFNVNFATTICNEKTSTFLSSKYALKSHNRKQLDSFFDYFSI